MIRLPRSYLDQPRYLHPNGYVIERARRTWSERGREPGRHHDPPPPLTWWDVYEHCGSDGVGRYHPWACKPRTVASADRLRDARRWCDEHPRGGWTS